MLTKAVVCLFSLDFNGLVFYSSVFPKILTGGPSRGTSFRPLNLSHDMPKPLFPLGGKPMIWHQLQALSEVQDCTEVFLIGFWPEETFSNFVKEANKEFTQFSIRYLREWQELGTGGGTYHFRDLITKGSPNAFFVLHSDIACSFQLNDLRSFHERHRGVGTIQATRVPKDSASRYGCIVANENALAIHYAEKPDSFVSDLVSTAAEDPSIASDEILRLEQDVIRPLADAHKMYVHETDVPWRPIKSAGSALPANALYLAEYQAKQSNLLYQSQTSENDAEIVQPVTIDPSAQVASGCKIGPFVSIGANVVVKEGARITHSIIQNNTTIEAHACVLYSIVGARGRLAPWARVEGIPFTGDDSAPTQSGICILAGDVSVTRDVIIRSCIVGQEFHIKHSLLINGNRFCQINH